VVPGGLELPRLDEGDFLPAALLERAESYQRGLVWIAVGALAAQIAVLAFMVWRGPKIARRIEIGPISVGIVVGLVTMVAAWAAAIPFTVLSTWWDRRYDLSSLSYVEAIFLPFAELGLIAVVGLATVATAMALARKLGRRWWLAGAPALAAIGTLFAFLLGYVLSVDTERAETRSPTLRRAVAQLERETGTEGTPVFVANVSGYTEVANAFTAGLGPSERVVLWDTLLDGTFTPREVEVVLAHELGHVARDHVWKGLGWLLLLAFPLLFAVAWVTELRGGLGLPGNVPLAALALVLAGICLAPAQNAISRHLEKEADWVALEATRDPEALRGLFAGFVRTSLTDPSPPSWTQALFGTHPSPLERVAMAEAWRERRP
jgi:STE24 endopeptidase